MCRCTPRDTCETVTCPDKAICEMRRNRCNEFDEDCQPAVPFCNQDVQWEPSVGTSLLSLIVLVRHLAILFIEPSKPEACGSGKPEACGSGKPEACGSGKLECL